MYQLRLESSPSRRGLGWEPSAEHLWLLWMFSLPNATTKSPSLTNMTGQSAGEWQQVVTGFLSRVKKLHIFFFREREKKSSPLRPSAAAQRMAGGFAAWKAGEERGGALWQALCERDGSRINCSGGRLPIAVSKLSSSVPGEMPGLNRTTKCLPRPLFSAKWALSLEWQD